MRVKLKDPRQHVKAFKYGEEYAMFFYGASGCVKFTHTRKKTVQLRSIGSGNHLESINTISKRELKQLMNEMDLVQWVVHAKENIEGETK